LISSGPVFGGIGGVISLLNQYKGKCTRGIYLEFCFYSQYLSFVFDLYREFVRYYKKIWLVNGFDGFETTGSEAI
jgi:hypothetical protein